MGIHCDRERASSSGMRMLPPKPTGSKSVSVGMHDRLTPERRSWNMSRIRAKDTKPELLVRSLLHQMGYRFRLHVKGMPGRPDIVLRKHKTVVFVQGCFWHRHKGCRKCTTPTNNREFWIKKLEGNVLRDKQNGRALRKLRWRVVVVWECEVGRGPKVLFDQLRQNLKSSEPSMATKFKPPPGS